jgi:hypothetical protein
MSDDYVAGHLEEALTHAGETDVHVLIEGERVVITGTVATEARRDAVGALATELTMLVVENDVAVVPCPAPDGREELRSSGEERGAS